ncbi:MAG: hypothetical protein ACTHM5_03575 [Ginsengibacter sp.]
MEQNRIKPLWFIDSLLYNKNNPTEISVKGDALFKDSAYYADGVFSKIITIGTDLQPLTDVEFSFVPPFVPPGADSSIIYYHVKLQSLDSTLSIYLYPPDTERELDIGPGDYKLIVIPTGANDPNNPYRSFIAGLRWSVLNMNADSLENNEWYGAGKRIKKIESWNSGQLESVKEYEYLNDSSQSSGQMIGLPNYYWIEKIVPGSGPIVEGYGSEPSSPLSQIQGNSLGYSRVTEYSGTRTMNQGKTVYEFTVNTDGGEYYKMPYYLPIDYEWIRGKPLSTKIYKNNGGSYELQRSIENKYLYAGTNSANIFSRAFTTPDNPVYVYRKDRKLFYLPLFTFAPCGEFDIDAPLCNTIYYQSAGTADLASTTEKTYANGQILTNVTNYGYDYERLYQPIKKTILTSTGDSVVSTFTYPPELISRTAPEQKLVDLNRIAVPIKTEIITKNSSGIQLAKTIKNIIYKDWGNDVVLPELMQSAINSEPLMTDATFNKYNPFGSPREITLKSGVKEVYVWGYKQQYPVAKITGSDYNTIIAFVDTTVLENASQYTDAQIRTELNKIRTGLAGTSAQVVTYTYTPSIGISSITDQRNRTVFYEYDAYGRLSLIRDHDNNILKKYCYNYAGQSEDCSTGCAPDWQSTGNYRCVKDSNNHNTGFQEREERNMESCSSTYNQTRWVNNGYNASACTPYIPCSSGNCDSRGPQYKCVDGVCETGFKVFTDSHFDSSIGHYVCTYHYEWSDDTWSQDYTQVNPGMFQCNLN